jgi:thiamine biosynthesis lipoprotein
MSTFESMGCEVVVSRESDAVRALFDERDRRFSRFISSSELNRVNATPARVSVVSEEFASMLSLAIGAARATGGLVTPAVGAALLASGYDRDFAELPPCGEGAVGPVRVPHISTVELTGRILSLAEPVTLDLNGVVKGKTVDDALALLGRGYVAAGGDVATNVPVVVGLPGGDSIRLYDGGLATSGVAKRTWLRDGERQHHLIDPATGLPARTPWRDVTVAASSCVQADVAAKAAFLLGPAGPSWLDRRGLAGRFVDAGGTVTVNESWWSRVPLERAA